MELTQNPSVLELVRKTAELTTPKEIVWIDGSEAQLESLRKIAVETGELIKLNEEKLPGCYLNRSDVNDVARVEGRTFICSRTREEAGPTNNWMDPDEMKAKLHEILRGAMAGRTMYVIPYAMGVIGSPFAKYGIEVTDSIYVVLNMAIMTRIGTKVLDALGDSSDVILGVHSKVTLDPENRYIVHFPEENKIISVNSNYGGNVLQGKKCFSLRIASVLGRRDRRCRRRAPRPDGHAPVLRLQHGRLLAALARHGREAAERAEDLQRQLVPHGRQRPLPVAGLRRQPARARVDPQALLRRGGRG